MCCAGPCLAFTCARRSKEPSPQAAPQPARDYIGGVGPARAEAKSAALKPRPSLPVTTLAEDQGEDGPATAALQAQQQEREQQAGAENNGGSNNSSATTSSSTSSTMDAGSADASSGSGNSSSSSSSGSDRGKEEGVSGAGEDGGEQ
ncbi:hypothetical protein DUNSADRAFT_7436 [Dunaliella salina]|uniref:Encoded protein n=1 Tax=Dunaliella salina TaxID=3046 RepID=A0ABQ7GLI3_DUNSA|nr:hypothetical protein DUNSADRAFT_7436 [Dunaliella salina]|eukprot:KAF5835448.1 hypothetical protein DUNSADRAFT_7436 [Dunaliella salina]